MSFLTGLFLFGAAAVTFPLFFHLIRRTPRGRVQFSSLMFLKPSPPRLTRRSRLDHLFLLLLRALAIILLALAFMRPFFRQSSDAALENVRGRRIAIVLDTSASMRRADLWQQALDEVKSQLDGVQPADDVALFTYADQVTSVIGFTEDKRAKPEQRRSLVRDALTRLEPTWAHTDTATALMSVAELLDVINDRTNSSAALQILLISDMQEGSRLQRLEGYEWPKDVHVEVCSVSPKRDLTNASVRLLVDHETGIAFSAGSDVREAGRPREQSVRVRVENASDSVADQFYVRWSGADGKTNDNEVAFHVPAGQSRVLQVPHTDDDLNADRLTLSGDDCPFDDQFYVVPFRQERVRIVYLGDDVPTNPDGLQLYLRMALTETRRRRVDVVGAADGDRFVLTGTDAPRLVVVAKPLSPAQQIRVDKFVRSGGTVLTVLQDEATLESLGTALSGVTIVDSNPTAEGQFALLGEIDFEHPLFSAFAASGYSDFTMIHFWQHRQIELESNATVQVLARFDNGSPAVLEQAHGRGKHFLLASGWNPEDSQLARTGKFAVLLGELLEHAGGPRWQSPTFVVNQPVALPVKPSTSGRAAVVKPDGTSVKLGEGANIFNGANLPGIYRASFGSNTHEFAVNLAPSESETAPVDVDRLETLGVQLGQHATQAEETERLRQLRDIELESKQQVWRWLIVAALAILVVETWLAGRYARGSAAVK